MTKGSSVGMSYLALMDRIAGYFSSAGYSVTVKDGIVWLSRLDLRGAVWPVPMNGGLDDILSAVMGATEFSNKHGASYVALPIQLARRIDESHFWTYGLGLIVYDDETVKEVLQPRIRAEAPPRLEDGHKNVGDADGEAFKELDASIIEELVKRIERIERNIARLDELEFVLLRLEALERRLQAREAVEVRVPPSHATERAQVQVAQASHRSGAASTTENALPSFLRNNPWIEVLAQKR